jgi:hypothetical protein
MQLHLTGEALFTAAVGDGVDATSLFVVRISGMGNNQYPERACVD